MSPSVVRLGPRSRYSEPVAVWIFKVALTSSKTLFIDGDPELLRDRVDVVDVQVNEGVGPCVSLVLREIDPNASACHRNERGKAWLELMLPLPLETESLVPGDSPSGVLDVQDGDDLFVQASELIGATRDSAFAWASVAECPLSLHAREAGHEEVFRAGAGVPTHSGLDCCSEVALVTERSSLVWKTYASSHLGEARTAEDPR
jgi:hypothetical protein